MGSPHEGTTEGSSVKIEKYTNGAKWYVRINGTLAAGFIDEKHADLFMRALSN